jgi:hypothetical protein
VTFAQYARAWKKTCSKPINGRRQSKTLRRAITNGREDSQESKTSRKAAEHPSLEDLLVSYQVFTKSMEFLKDREKKARHDALNCKGVGAAAEINDSLTQ